MSVTPGVLGAGGAELSVRPHAAREHETISAARKIPRYRGNETLLAAIEKDGDNLPRGTAIEAGARIEPDQEEQGTERRFTAGSTTRNYSPIHKIAIQNFAIQYSREWAPREEKPGFHIGIIRIIQRRRPGINGNAVDLRQPGGQPMRAGFPACRPGTAESQREAGRKACPTSLSQRSIAPRQKAYRNT